MSVLELDIKDANCKKIWALGEAASVQFDLANEYLI